MANDIKMTLGASIILNKVLNAILFVDQSTTPAKERPLSLPIKYKLQRAKSLVEKDCAFFDTERDNLIKEMGVEKEDHSAIYVPEDKLDEYKKRLTELVQLEISHDFLKIKPEDVANIDVEGLTTEEVALFMAYLIDDEDLIKDLSTPIEKPVKEEEKPVEEEEK